jgi:hypothetical protein
MTKEGKLTKARIETSPVGARDVTRWLKQCLYMVAEDDEEPRRLVQIQCCHVTHGSKKGEHVFDVKVPKSANDDWADSTGLELYSRLQLEVSNLGGLQRYVLYAYHSGDNERHTARFVVRFEGTDEDDELTTETPTKEGLLAQLMRHNEVQQKVLVSMMGTLSQTSQSIISRLTAMNENLLNDKLESIEAMQAITADKDEREVKLIQAKAKARGVEDLVGRLGLLLPAIANKVAGQTIFPVQESAVTMMTKALVTSLATDEKRMEQFVAIMKPEEVVAFSNLFQALNTQPADSKPENSEDTETH